MNMKNIKIEINNIEFNILTINNKSAYQDKYYGSDKAAFGLKKVNKNFSKIHLKAAAWLISGNLFKVLAGRIIRVFSPAKTTGGLHALREMVSVHLKTEEVLRELDENPKNGTTRETNSDNLILKNMMNRLDSILPKHKSTTKKVYQKFPIDNKENSQATIKTIIENDSKLSEANQEEQKTSTLVNDGKEENYNKASPDKNNNTNITNTPEPQQHSETAGNTDRTNYEVNLPNPEKTKSNTLEKDGEEKKSITPAEQVKTQPISNSKTTTTTPSTNKQP